MIAFVCPLCKGPLESSDGRYACAACRREYPVLCGIPDFRILPDRYISMDDDRRKGERLFAEVARRGFAEMLDFYYSITPEVPADLAKKFTAHALAEVEIAKAALDELGSDVLAGPLLDVGCSTGGLLVAAARRFFCSIGVDVAFRWLVVGTARLREAGVAAPLACANAEYLPFPPDSFAAVTATDVIEHLIDPAPAFVEARRVAAPGGAAYFSTNNRYSIAPEPHVNVWGVGWFPRALQPSYVLRISGRPYRNIALRSAREIRRWARAAGFHDCALEATPLHAPGRAAAPQALYNRLRRVLGVAALLRLIGPRLQLRCLK